MQMDDVRIEGYRPGALGEVVALHGAYYATHWSFGPVFEARVAHELGELFTRFDTVRDGFWVARLGGKLAGSITIDGSAPSADGARLRFFITSDLARGRGIGNLLMKTALDFCRRREFRRVYLWTFAGLNAARHLYEKFGFRLVEEVRGDGWGRMMQEQKMTFDL